MFDETKLYHCSDEALRVIGTEATLASWRSRSVGPPYFRLRGKIYYRGDDLNRWVEAARIEPAPTAA